MGASGARVAITVTDSMTGSRRVTQCPKVNRGSPCAEKWDAWGEKGAVGVKVRVRGSEVEIH